MAEVVSGMIDAMTSSLERPYALIGHSLGGLLAFEAARALRSRGLPAPAALFVSAARAPHLPYPYPPLAAVPDDRLLLEVNARYEGSVPHQILDNAELHELFIPALRGDLAVLESYAYREEAPLDCPLSVFGGTRDRTLSAPALEGWAMHTRGEFRLRMLSEGHLFLQSARETLVDAVRHELLGSGVRTHAVGE
jgi:medium-chain acyl-[acyl-carrier-protein] hydrolase